MTTAELEKTLLSAVASGDRSAFKDLYTAHLDDLLRYMYLLTKCREESEEIVQSVFVKIWEKREMLSEIDSFRFYLYRCAKNLMLDRIRRNIHGAEALSEIKTRSSTAFDNADSKIIYDQYYQLVHKAIQLLPAKRKQIVTLKTADEYSFDEIAKLLSISKSVVKKQLYAGMIFIRTYVKKHGELDL